MLSRAQVRRYYDRLGPRLDWHSFWLNPAIEDLIAHAAFPEARTVFELGCGTGRFAEHLLAERLAPGACYHAIDLSPRMVELARVRLGRFGRRAIVQLGDGTGPIDAPDGAFDRFVATYVLDLLPTADIHATVAEAHRTLATEGLLCLVSLCPGVSVASRLLTRTWEKITAIRPTLTGGCRPIELQSSLARDAWHVRRPGGGTTRTTRRLTADLTASPRCRSAFRGRFPDDGAPGDKCPGCGKPSRLSAAGPRPANTAEASSSRSSGGKRCRPAS